MRGGLAALSVSPPIAYDHRNQMVEHHDTSTLTIRRYQYDALGRRVTAIADAENPGASTTSYVNGGQASTGGWQVLAEYDGVTTSANLAATYVYGSYIDEPIQMSRDYDGSRAGAVQHFYYHQDDLFNVVALTAGPAGATLPAQGEGQPQSFAAGAVVERVRYGDYGVPDVRSATGAKWRGSVGLAWCSERD